MKYIIQVTLFSLMILIGYIFYDNYFVKKEIIEKKIISTNNIEKNQNEIKPEAEIQSNAIRNLKYKIDITNNGTYEVSSDSSVLIFEKNIEIVLMKQVSAIFTDNKNRKLYISSDDAKFNTLNYNTFFSNNVKISYIDTIITSNKLKFDFIKNNILVFENVEYRGPRGEMYTDNIKINLITKDIKFYMNDAKKNVKLLSY